MRDVGVRFVLDTAFVRLSVYLMDSAIKGGVSDTSDASATLSEGMRAAFVNKKQLSF